MRCVTGKEIRQWREYMQTGAIYKPTKMKFVHFLNYSYETVFECHNEKSDRIGRGHNLLALSFFCFYSKSDHLKPQKWEASTLQSRGSRKDIIRFDEPFIGVDFGQKLYQETHAQSCSYRMIRGQNVCCFDDCFRRFSSCQNLFCFIFSS